LISSLDGMYFLGRGSRSLAGRLWQGCARRSFVTTSRRAAEQVRIVEVGPRDGLQNEKATVPLKTKIELIDRLAQTGLRDIEAGSFVAPKWIPQMANSAEILQHLLTRPPPAPHGITYSFLVPNTKGLENFLSISDQALASASSPQRDGARAGNTTTQDPNKMSTSAAPPTPPPSPSPSSTARNGARAGIKSTRDAKEMSSSTSRFGSERPPVETEIAVFAAATESFSKANLNCTIAESIERFRPIFALSKEHNLRVRAYISVVLGCPYEGSDVSAGKVAELSATLLEMGADEISLGDTTGMGTAPRTSELLKALHAAGISNHDLAVHFHDTYGQALVNTVVALEQGIRTFDSSVGGLGGCPYSKGATGNVATEDLVHCIHSLGASTGVSLEKTAEIGAWISKELGRPNESRAGKAILAKLAA